MQEGLGEVRVTGNGGYSDLRAKSGISVPEINLVVFRQCTVHADELSIIQFAVIISIRFFYHHVGNVLGQHFLINVARLCEKEA